MSVYCDTSVLGSLYCHDVHETRARQLLDGSPPLPLTVIQFFELTNMVRFKVSRRELTEAAGRTILGHVASDEATGVLMHAPVVLAEVFDEAVELSRLYGEGIGGRGYDILHVAAARVLGWNDFLTFDIQQARLATAAGLSVHT